MPQYDDVQTKRHSQLWDITVVIQTNSNECPHLDFPYNIYRCNHPSLCNSETDVLCLPENCPAVQKPDDPVQIVRDAIAQSSSFAHYPRLQNIEDMVREELNRELSNSNPVSF